MFCFSASPSPVPPFPFLLSCGAAYVLATDPVLQVWSHGLSTVGAGAECKLQAVEVPVEVCGLTINPGDLLFLDEASGVVRIPRALADPVAAWLERRGDAEERIKAFVRAGGSVAEAFERYR